MTPHPEEGALHAFIDGELGAAEASALEAHVTTCSLCAAALAEARGFVAGASRVVTSLDAAPSSASRPAAEVLTAARRVNAKPKTFRVPFARAAALLLLAGGSAVVITQSTPDQGTSTSTSTSTSVEAASADVAPLNGGSVAQPAPASSVPPPPPVLTPTPNSSPAPAGAAVRKGIVAAPMPLAAAPTSARIASTGEAAAEKTQQGSVAGSAADLAAAASAQRVPPPPARMSSREELALSAPSAAAAPAVRVTRYRTREGTILTLTDEPTRASFAEESESAPRLRASGAQAPAQVMNSYRWSSVEQGRSYTLTGPLTVAELEAAARGLAELERIP